MSTTDFDDSCCCPNVTEHGGSAEANNIPHNNIDCVDFENDNGDHLEYREDDNSDHPMGHGDDDPLATPQKGGRGYGSSSNDRNLLGSGSSSRGGSVVKNRLFSSTYCLVEGGSGSSGQRRSFRPSCPRMPSVTLPRWCAAWDTTCSPEVKGIVWSPNPKSIEEQFTQSVKKIDEDHNRFLQEQEAAGGLSPPLPKQLNFDASITGDESPLKSPVVDFNNDDDDPLYNSSRGCNKGEEYEDHCTLTSASTTNNKHHHAHIHPQNQYQHHTDNQQQQPVITDVTNPASLAQTTPTLICPQGGGEEDNHHSNVFLSHPTKGGQQEKPHHDYGEATSEVASPSAEAITQCVLCDSLVQMDMDECPSCFLPTTTTTTSSREIVPTKQLAFNNHDQQPPPPQSAFVASNEHLSTNHPTVHHVKQAEQDAGFNIEITQSQSTQPQAVPLKQSQPQSTRTHYRHSPRIGGHVEDVPQQGTYSGGTTTTSSNRSSSQQLGPAAVQREYTDVEREQLSSLVAAYLQNSHNNKGKVDQQEKDNTHNYSPYSNVEATTTNPNSPSSDCRLSTPGGSNNNNSCFGSAVSSCYIPVPITPPPSLISDTVVTPEEGEHLYPYYYRANQRGSSGGAYQQQYSPTTTSPVPSFVGHLSPPTDLPALNIIRYTQDEGKAGGSTPVVGVEQLQCTVNNYSTTSSTTTTFRQPHTAVPHTPPTHNNNHVQDIYYQTAPPPSQNTTARSYMPACRRSPSPLPHWTASKTSLYVELLTQALRSKSQHVALTFAMFVQQNPGITGRFWKDAIKEPRSDESRFVTRFGDPFSIDVGVFV